MEQVELQRVEAAIEAILFTMGNSVELSRIAAAVGHDEETVKKIIHNMMDRYHEEDRGIQIIELEDAFQMCTKKEMYEYLIRVASVPKKQQLTDVLLETLSIIAYKQPVTKMDIEKMVEYSLVCEAGRLDAPGKPILFATTEEFLRCFGVSSLEELPLVKQDKLEEFRQEAEEEVQLKLDI